MSCLLTFLNADDAASLLNATRAIMQAIAIVKTNNFFIKINDFYFELSKSLNYIIINF